MKKFFAFLIIIIIFIFAIGAFSFSKKNISISAPFTEIKNETTKTSEKKEEEPKSTTFHLPTPEIVRAIYLTSWSAGLDSKIDYVINLKKRGLINAVVIDIKDFSGTIAYDTDIDEVNLYKAEEKRIRNLEGRIKKLHDENIYTIARITIFQDPILAYARPELAVHDKTKLASNSLSQKTIWLDHKKLAWIDPSSKEAWDYNIKLAKDASDRGFDELNFDYIRFPSDGAISNMVFPNWDKKLSKAEVIKSFFEYLRANLKDKVISADTFGLTTTVNNDMEIGQVIENAYLNFDYVAPMIYPSHYPKGFIGLKNPADHPYEIVNYAMEGAQKKWDAQLASSTSPVKLAKIRPWLQDFDLGATYTTKMIQDQIKATQNALKDNYAGFMMWSPRNIYNEEGLR